MKKIKKRIQALSNLTNIKEEYITVDVSCGTFVCEDIHYYVLNKKELKKMAKEYFETCIYDEAKDAFEKGVLMMLQESFFSARDTYIPRPILENATSDEREYIDESMKLLLSKSKAFKKMDFLNKLAKENYEKVDEFYIQKM